MPDYLWTDRQFDEMSWHDNHVHALRVVEGAYGAGELVLDLDYIVEWICDAEGCSFRIVPATLSFLEVTNLRLSLDYASASAAMGPFSIHAIERRDEPRERYVAQVWKIAINWPKGEIEFEAKGFVQRATGEPVVSAAQCLRPEERGSHVRAG
ncbi:hypothetical protein AZOA_35130 [Azoarcus sp. Aa7]|nr:hypothetical protein [Azoarcus sp. Aa7]